MFYSFSLNLTVVAYHFNYLCKNIFTITKVGVVFDPACVRKNVRMDIKVLLCKFYSTNC